MERLPYHKTSLIQKKEVPYWKKDISTKISKVHFLYTMTTTCDMFHSRKFRMVALNQPLFFFVGVTRSRASGTLRCSIPEADHDWYAQIDPCMCGITQQARSNYCIIATETTTKKPQKVAFWFREIPGYFRKNPG